jgi:hypothetical protein
MGDPLNDQFLGQITPQSQAFIDQAFSILVTVYHRTVVKSATKTAAFKN